jgi:hypothetical protein
MSHNKNIIYKKFFKMKMKKMLLESNIKSINDLAVNEKSKFMSEVRKQVDKHWQVNNNVILKITADMLRGMILNEVKNKINQIKNNDSNEEILPALKKHFNIKETND